MSRSEPANVACQPAQPVNGYASIGAGACLTPEELPACLDRMKAEAGRQSLNGSEFLIQDLLNRDTIYFVTEAGTFLALDRDAKTIWEKEVGGKIYTNPVVSGDMLLVAPYKADFALAAYDAEGKQAWTFTPEK